MGFGVAVTSVFSTVSEPEPHPVRTLPDITANKKNKAAFFHNSVPFHIMFYRSKYITAALFSVFPISP